MECRPGPFRSSTTSGFTSGLPVGLDTHENAGATEPRREPDDLENVRRSRYFFLAAFFLAAGFLAAFFFAAMMVYLLDGYLDPMNGFGVGGSQCIPAKRSASSHRVVASVMATTSSIALQIVVIPEQTHSCQWDSHEGVSETTERAVAETAAMSAIRLTY